MIFSLSEEQTALQDTVRRFCQANYKFSDRHKVTASPIGFSRTHWKFFAAQGWLGAALPEDVGGTGGSAIECALIMEEFGRSLVVEPFLSCAVLAAQAVNAGASEAQRRDLLHGVIAGDLQLALAHGEREARGRVQHVETRAALAENGGYRIDGRKALVLGGPEADKFIISARTDGDNGDPHGISLFVVDRDTPGLVRHDYRLIDGFRASDLTLDHVQVPADALLGTAGQALGALEVAIDHAIVAICAEACGAMDAVLWMTRDYLRTRSQYGTTLNSFQALQHRMADMLVEVELSRSMLLHALHVMSQQDQRLRRKGISAAKVQIGQSGRHVGANSIQLHGGIGVTEEFSVGHYFKRLTAISQLFGSIDHHLEEFSRYLK